MSDEKYEFSQDWFSWAPPVWSQLIGILPARKQFLEIGSYEGTSTVWTLEHMLEDGGCLVAVDTWEGGDEHKKAATDMSVVEARFKRNIDIATAKFPERRVEKLKMDSRTALAKMMTPAQAQFDFIYIDGSHRARDVLTDAVMAFPLLKDGGIMVFDDYQWGDPTSATERPKVAIDAFTTIFADEFQIIHAAYQLAGKKVNRGDKSE